MQSENGWRMTGMRVLFVFVDSRAALILPLVLFHARLWTLMVVLTSLAVLAFLERRGYTVEVALRMLATLLVTGGKSRFMISHRPALWAWHQRKGK